MDVSSISEMALPGKRFIPSQVNHPRGEKESCPDKGEEKGQRLGLVSGRIAPRRIRLPRTETANKSKVFSSSFDGDHLPVVFGGEKRVHRAESSPVLRRSSQR